MNKINQFKIRLLERNLENLADPPDDPLAELSDFELGLRRFCYECDHQVMLQVGDTEFRVFLDPDICMLLEDQFPEQIRKLVNHQTIRLDFTESYWIFIKLVPVGDQIKCYLRELSDTKEKIVILNKQEVVDELQHFLIELMELAFNRGYISLEDKDEFIKPAIAPSEMLV